MFNPLLGDNNRICPQCRQQFTCQIAQGEETCWCFHYPNVIPNAQMTHGGQTCICPDCLRARIVQQAMHTLDIDDEYDSDEQWSN